MSLSRPPSPRSTRRRWLVGGALVLVIAAVLGWRLAAQSPDARNRTAPPTTVVTAEAQTRDVPVRLAANGTVTPLQTVDLRSQITSTVKQVHIREGQDVTSGELLFTLDAAPQRADLERARAQLEKDTADFATAQRNLQRQVDLFNEKFISMAALDTAKNQVDTLNGQLAIDRAAIQSASVALSYTDIRAPFEGRTGVINVRAGSLVQPSTATSTTTSPPLVTVTQVDPIAIAFTLPEKEFPGLQAVLAAGAVTASASIGPGTFSGRIMFVDNAVDTTTGTIRVKAQFDNPQGRLWPGMFVNVSVSPRTLRNATVIPAQAVQTGPTERFVYVVEADHKVARRVVTLAYVEETFAVVDGVRPGVRVVVEGGQNLRPGSVVAEAERPAGGAAQDSAKGEGRSDAARPAGNPA